MSTSAAIQIKSGSTSLFLYFSIALFLAALFVEMIIAPGLRILPTPDFSAPSLLKICLTGLGGLLLVLYIVQHSSQSASQINQPLPQRIFPLAHWGILLGSLVVLFIFLIDPIVWEKAAAEDHPVEWLSAIGLFFACLTMIVVTVSIYRSQLPARQILFVLALGLAFFTFVSGMEEASWFQRVFHVATPDSFAGNGQHEMNLHNFASNFFEDVYYFFSFVLLIFVPFVMTQTNLAAKLKRYSLFIPTTSVLLASMMLTANNYHLWNRTTTQFAFFVSLWILTYYTYKSWKKQGVVPAHPYFLTALLVLFVVTQAIYLASPASAEVPWLVSEYKELIIPFGFVVYTMDIFLRIRKSMSASEVGVLVASRT